MKMKKKSKKNDVYILNVTKNFVVINDNYEGLIILDKSLSFRKKLSISEELVIYQTFSSELNDYIVIQDVEEDKLYSINVLSDQVVELNCDTIFSSYYYVKGEEFILYAKGIDYHFSYQTLEIEMVKNDKFSNGVVLSNDQDDCLCKTKSNRIVNENVTIMEISTVEDYHYDLNQKKIIKYSESIIFVYKDNNWLPIFRVEENFSIRKCVLSYEKLYILINVKNDIESSEIKILPIKFQ